MSVQQRELGSAPQRAVVRGAGALAAMLCALVAPLASAVTASAADRFEIQVVAGYDGFARPDDWTPVRVTVRNNGGDFQGTLQVDDAARASSGSSGGFGGNAMPSFAPANPGTPVGGAAHQVLVVLPAGATRHYTLYLASAQRPRATLLSGASPVAQAEPAQSLTFTGPTTMLVAVVSDQADTLDQVALAKPAPTATVHVVHFKPADLPASGVLLRSFDTLAFDNASTDLLTGDQRTAVRDYVEGAGGLLVVGGPGARKTIAGLPAQLLPVTVSSVARNDLHVLGGLVSMPAPAGGGEISVGELSAGAHAVRDGAVPLVAWRSFGSGVVVYTAFDAGAEPLASWPGEKVLLRQLVDRASGTPTANGAANFGKGVSVRSRLGTSAIDYNSMSSVLTNLPSLDIPALGLVGWLLLAYAIAVGPVNYLVLKRMRRRHFAWLTIPALVAVSSSAVLLIGLTVKGVGTQVNQVRVMALSPGSSRQYVVTYSGLVAAHRGDYSLALADASYAGSGPINNGSDNSVNIQDSPPRAVLTGVTAYAIRTVASEGYSDGAGHLDADLRVTGTNANGLGGQVVGRVTNHTGMDLEDAVVIYRGQFQQLGVLHAGQGTDVSFTAGSGTQFNGPVNGQIYPNTYSNSSTATDRQQQRRSQIVAAVTNANSGFTAVQLGPPRFVAFAPSALREPVVDGHGVKVQGEAVVVMQVPLGPDPAVGNILTGEVQPTLVDIEGNAQSQGYNGPNIPVTQVSGGSVTYEFDLPGGGWKSADLTVAGAFAGAPSCQVFSGLPVPPPPGVGNGGGAAAPTASGPCTVPNLSMFNFSTDQWVAVKASNSQLRFALDPAAISPDGAVLVRFAAPPGSTSLVQGPALSARRGST